MRIIFLGDIMGKSGKQAIANFLPQIKERLNPDIVIANAENTSHGFGLTENHANFLFNAGIDFLTGGNHTLDNPDVLNLLNNNERIIRPLNIDNESPGSGAQVYTTKNNHKVLIVNLLARLFMDLYDDPFKIINETLPESNPCTSGLDAVIVDFHGETTSEKYAMAHYIDGRASLLVGTHTHIPTADAQIFPKGTGFQCDAGMCGCYNSVIGMEAKGSLARFLGQKIPRPKLVTDKGAGTVSGVVVDTDPKTGLANKIHPLIIGPNLIQTEPRYTK